MRDVWGNMTFCTLTAEMIKSLPTAAVIGGVHERPHLIKLLTNISIKNLICSLMQPLHHGRPLCHTPVFSKLQHLSIRRFVVGLSRHRQAEAPRRRAKGSYSSNSFCMGTASTQGRDSKIRSLECLDGLVGEETQLYDLQIRWIAANIHPKTPLNTNSKVTCHKWNK